MAQDALDEKITLIVAKSASRFAKNMVDSLAAVRKRRGKGAKVCFEKENICMPDSKGGYLSLPPYRPDLDSIKYTWHLVRDAGV